MTIPLDAVVADLEHVDRAYRQRAAEVLARMGDEARPAAVPLVKACGDTDAEVREWVAAALEDLGPPLPDDIERLGRLLGSPNPGIGYWAATLLGRCGADAAATVSGLADVLERSAFLEVRQRAAWALGKIGPAAAAAVPALEAAARADDPRLARLAGQALDAIRSP